MTKINTVILTATLATVLFNIVCADVLKDTTGKVHLNYAESDNGLRLEVVRENKVLLSGKIGVGKNLQNVKCKDESRCTFGDKESLLIEGIKNGFNISWRIDDPKLQVEECFNLQSNDTNWYGGPQRYRQVWPLEKMTIDGNEPYIIKKSDNFGVAERYWLNSKGVYIYVSDTTPLWVDQNNKNKDQVCFKAEAIGPYVNRTEVNLEYQVVTLEDPKAAHLDAVKTYLGKPRTHPNEKMIQEPIWTTWAKYKRPINDAIVLQFANEIRSHGYTGGQLEIDDNWESCYGSQEFDSSTFGDISNTVASLHKDNWRVSLWIHPFVNDNCQNNSRDGLANGYFAHNSTGQTHAEWWNGNDAHQIDFTLPDAAEWWSARVKKLHASPGIDSFKFDAGEADYANQPVVFADVDHTPNILTQKYIETCAAFGDLIEVRSSFKGQHYGIFIRMLDKESTWTLNNGLPTLITTLLQLNMNGYTMVLPDMIGGNGYIQNPTGDLIVRWTQANTFMPAMQFSYLPWDFKDQVSYDIETIIKKYVDLHAQYTPNIIRAMNKSITDGTPVNPPIWWIDPTDPIALASDDEFLLGEEILVAPVIVENAVSRDIYLPKGQWKDGNNGTVYTGPVSLKNYPAPIETLPYFILQ